MKSLNPSTLNHIISNLRWFLPLLIPPSNSTIEWSMTILSKTLDIFFAKMVFPILRFKEFGPILTKKDFSNLYHVKGPPSMTYQKKKKKTSINGILWKFSSCIIFLKCLIAEDSLAFLSLRILTILNIHQHIKCFP